jgi:hypothetical protein
VSHPRHPKSDEIDRALLEMRPWKEIRSMLGIGERSVNSAARRLTMLRIPVTRAERELLADRRGIDRRLVP